MKTEKNFEKQKKLNTQFFNLSHIWKETKRKIVKSDEFCFRFKFADFQEKLDDESRIDISICVNAILRKYLKNDYLKNSSTIFLNLLPNDETSSMATQERILRLLNEDPFHQVNLIIKDDSSPSSDSEPKAREKAKNYLILVTFPTEIVENIKKLQKLATWWVCWQ